MKLEKITKRAVKRFKKAEKSGALERWKTRIGLGIQAAEIAMLATAAAKGLKIGKAAAPPKRRVRAIKKRSSRAT